MTFLSIVGLVIACLVLHSKISSLRERVEHMERYLQNQTARTFTPLAQPQTLQEEAQRVRIEHEMRAAATLKADVFERVLEQPHGDQPQREHGETPYVPPAVVVQARAPESYIQERAQRQEEKIEFKFSSSILVWVGVIAVLLGVGFFLKYSFDHDIIGPTGRVLLGVLAGVVCMGIAEHLRTKYAEYAYVLSGTGIALLYLSFYGTLYYELGSPLATLFLMGLVTAVSLLLSVRYDSRGIAALGIIGGYCTPLFFGDIARGMGGLVLLNYLVILDIGVLVLAYYRQWSWAAWTGFLGTALLMAGWLASSFYEVTDFTIAFVYLTIYWLIFTCATLIFYYFHDRLPGNADALLMVLVGLQYAGTVYALLLEVYGGNERFFGLIPLVLAVVYTGIAYLGITLRTMTRPLALYPLGAAVFFLTLVFPFEFDGPVLTVAWLVEAAVLGGIAVLIRSRSLMRLAMPVYGLGIFFLFVDMPETTMETVPILNERFFLFGVAIVVAYVLMYSFARLGRHLAAAQGEGGVVEKEPEGIDGMFLLANALVGIMVVLELFQFGWFFADPLHTPSAIVNARFLFLFAVTVYAYSVLYLSLAQGRGGRVIGAFVSANILAIICGLLELADYARTVEEYHAIVNARTLIFGIGVLYAGIVAYVAARGIPGVLEPVRSVARGMFVVLNLLLLFWGLLEIVDYYAYLEQYVALLNVRTLILLLAAVYSGGMAYVLMRRREREPDLVVWPTTFFVVTNIALAWWVFAECAGYYRHLVVYEPLTNVRALMLLLAFGFSVVMAYWFYRHSAVQSVSRVGAWYGVVANMLLVSLGLIEILDYHNKVLIAQTTEYALRDSLQQQASMYVTGYLVLYGFVALVLGLMRRFVLLRNIAIVILSCAVIKVFLSDIWALDAIYRIVALLSLGITLLVVAYLYYRYKDRLGKALEVTEQHHEY